MYQPKISRIRPSSKTARSKVLRYIFLGIIALAILIGAGTRLANAAVGDPMFDNPMAQYLHEEGVSFILRNDTDTLIILRSGEPAEFPTGYTNPQAVCERLATVGAPANVVLFDMNSPVKAVCN